MKKLYNIYKDITYTEDKITIDNFLKYNASIKDQKKGIKHVISKKILTEMFNGYDDGDQKIDFIEFYNIFYGENRKDGWWLNKENQEIEYDDLTENIYKFSRFKNRFNTNMKNKPERITAFQNFYIKSINFLSKIPEKKIRNMLKKDYYFFVTTKIDTKNINNDLKNKLKIFDLNEIEDKYNKLSTSYTDQKRKLEKEIEQIENYENSMNENSMKKIKEDIDMLAEIFNEYKTLVESDDCKNYKDYMKKKGTPFEPIDIVKINITEINLDKIYPKSKAGTAPLTEALYNNVNVNIIFNVLEKNFKTPYYIQYIHF